MPEPPPEAAERMRRKSSGGAAVDCGRDERGGATQKKATRFRAASAI